MSREWAPLWKTHIEQLPGVGATKSRLQDNLMREVQYLIAECLVAFAAMCKTYPFEKRVLLQDWRFLCVIWE